MIKNAKGKILKFIYYYGIPCLCVLSGIVILLTTTPETSFVVYYTSSLAIIGGIYGLLTHIDTIKKERYSLLLEKIKKQQVIIDTQRLIIEVHRSQNPGAKLELFLRDVLGLLASQFETSYIILFLKEEKDSILPKALYFVRENISFFVFFLEKLNIKNNKLELKFLPISDSIKENEGEVRIKLKDIDTPSPVAIATISFKDRALSQEKKVELMEKYIKSIEIDCSYIQECMESREAFWSEYIENGKKIRSCTHPLIVENIPGEDSLIGALKIGTFITESDNLNSPEDTSELDYMKEILHEAIKPISHAILKEQIYLKAITDPLTSLYTKRHFETNINNFMGMYQRYGTVFSLLMLDIDHFKRVNDTYGHLTGDMVLKEVARVIYENIRETDLAFRYGGEEIAIILPNSSMDSAYVIANRIRVNISKLKFYSIPDKIPFQVTVSIGIATIDKSVQNIEDIINRADSCLYKAKEKGRNKVICYGRE